LALAQTSATDCSVVAIEARVSGWGSVAVTVRRKN
jgi:hypothetical protein